MKPSYEQLHAALENIVRQHNCGDDMRIAEAALAGESCPRCGGVIFALPGFAPGCENNCGDLRQSSDRG